MSTDKFRRMWHGNRTEKVVVFQYDSPELRIELDPPADVPTIVYKDVLHSCSAVLILFSAARFHQETEAAQAVADNQAMNL